MNRMVIVRNKDESVSCLPVMHKKDYYNERYEVIVYVNKLWNPYYITRIKQYFEKKKL